MTYTSEADLQTRYGDAALIEITDRATPATGTIDSALVVQACADVAALIDGYVGGNYALPIADASIPPMLKQIAARLAFADLHPFTPPEKIEKEAEEARRQLRDIARGRIKLSIAGVAATEASSQAAQVTDRPAVLSATKTTGFM